VADEATQGVINEEAERRLVAAYINGLLGYVGQQVKFRMPHTLEEAVQVAVTVNNAERMRATDTKRVFSARRDNASQNITYYNCGKKGIIPEIACHQSGTVAFETRLGAESRLRPAQCGGIPPLRASGERDKMLLL
jgi:hypothetical protein